MLTNGGRAVTQNVLIVEDDLMIADLLCEAIETDGYHVTGVARNLEEAIIACERNHADFAVIDIHLADRSLGTEVAERLRSIAPIQVIFSTGNDDETLTTEQGDAVMVKPYRMRDVGGALRIITEMREFGRTEIVFPRNFRLLEAAVA